MVGKFVSYDIFIFSKCIHRCRESDRKVGYKCTKGRLGQTTNTIFALGEWDNKMLATCSNSWHFFYNLAHFMQNDILSFLGGSWIRERNVLFGDDSNENYCKLQCLLRDDCEHTSSINVW